MYRFLISHLRGNITRTLGMGIVIAIVFFMLIGGLYVYQNVSRAIRYYSYDSVDERRFTLRSSANMLDLFGSSNRGISNATISALTTDARIERVQSFRLVEIPVVADFQFFTFHFETDLPVFAVTDSALSGAQVPIGISRAMVDFYNSQFAGSAPVFPQMNPKFLIGQGVRITFGASKIFPSVAKVASPIDGKIMTIGDDFPGFGIVLPESIVQAKMTETGYQLGKPYKVVAYMKSPTDRSMIEKDYGSDNPLFDADGMRETERQMMMIATILGSVIIIVSVLIIVFFLFLLASYFRERRDVFRMVSVFGLTSWRSYVLTLGEPIMIITLSTILSGLMFWYIFSLANYFFTEWLASKGILFTVIPIPVMYYSILGIGIIVLFSLLVVGFEMKARKKYIFR